YFKTQPLCWHSIDAVARRGRGRRGRNHRRNNGEGEGDGPPKEEEKLTAVEEGDYGSQLGAKSRTGFSTDPRSRVGWKWQRGLWEVREYDGSSD
ncbi:hypothetical protein GW17_00047566, partial [Ensete ventricosum]